MNLKRLLAERRADILEKWRARLFACYPPETAGFLQKEADRFSNPVAHRLTEGLKGLFAVVLEDGGAEAASVHLDEVLRIWAVQNFTPSQALAFVFFLKPIIREELAKEIRADAGMAEEMLDLESRLDGLALLGFDVYMKRREKLSDLRVEEVKARVSGLLRRAGVDLDTL
jgi:hypothetical protein